MEGVSDFHHINVYLKCYYDKNVEQEHFIFRLLWYCEIFGHNALYVKLINTIGHEAYLDTDKSIRKFIMLLPLM